MMGFVWAGRAAALERHGICVVSSGVAVRVIDGAHVAVVAGGYRSRVNRQAVIDAARAALADWPTPIDRLDVHVASDPPRNRYTRRGRAVRGLA